MNEPLLELRWNPVRPIVDIVRDDPHGWYYTLDCGHGKVWSPMGVECFPDGVLCPDCVKALTKGQPCGPVPPAL